MLKITKTFCVLLFTGLVSLILAGCAGSKYERVSNVSNLDVSFAADSIWDGKKVPKGQQCNRFGGKGATPEIVVSNIPKGANALILKFSDRSAQNMNNGGHGILMYSFPINQTSVTVQAIPGHTFELPTGFKSISAHRNPSWDTAGAYMPPCSGGRNNLYELEVMAVFDSGSETGSKLLAEGDLVLGRY